MRTAVWLIRPREASMRIISCWAGISMENTRIGASWCKIACSTRFMAKDVLPMEGRPATMIRSDFCRPEVLLSRSRKPVLKPVILPPARLSSSTRSSVPLSSVSTSSGPPAFGPCSPICIMRRSASSISSPAPRPRGLKPLSAMVWAASIRRRSTDRSRTTCA